jgi:hypothetical protein
LGWDQILKATVAAERQADFDRNIVAIGLPLYRLAHRLSVQDWAGLEDLAERLYQNLSFDGLEPKQNPRAAYLICVATMKSRLYRGKRAAAVLPFLQAAKIQQLWQANGNDHLAYLPKPDASSMQSSEILPIWFDGEQVESVFSDFASSLAPSTETDLPGPIVYLASMAIRTERLELARQLTQLLSNSNDQVEAWRLILLAQIQIAEGNRLAAAEFLEANHASLVGGAIPVAYYLGAAGVIDPQAKPGNDPSQLANSPKSAINEQADAILTLLKIPALFGNQYPDLSAAALYQSSQIAKSMAWDAEYQILEQELLNRYPRSLHGQLVEKTRRDIEK